MMCIFVVVVYVGGEENCRDGTFYIKANPITVEVCNSIYIYI